MDIRDRLDKLREAISKGPGLSLRAWVEAAGVCRGILKPSYAAEIREENKEALARGAAEILGWDRGQMEAWLLFGQEEPALEAFLAELPNLARCVGCTKWLPKKEVIRGVSRCLTCKREAGRLLARRQRDPHFDAIFDVAYQKLPQIRAVYPVLAKAVEECCADRSRAFTVARVQRIIGLSRARTEALLQEFGLTKVAVAVAAKSRSTFRCRFNRRATQRRRPGFQKWAREQNARWRHAPAAPNQIPLSLAGAA